MAINKKLIHFKEKADFVNEVANNNILDHSIVFIQDSKEISTHGTVYKTVNWSVLERESNYMKVVALEDGLTVSFTNPLEYSFDSKTWQSLPANTQTPAINKDQYVAFRANLTPKAESGIGTFSIDKQCDLKGSCMSLLFGDDFRDKNDLTGYDCAFLNLFSNQSNIKSVDPGFLPATTLSTACYVNMFFGCTSLTTAPELPATTLTDYCYQLMFGLCSSLVSAPELPATELATYCYEGMFKGCSSLTTAPELPATELKFNCYSNMFSGCSKLNYIKALFTTTPSSSYTKDWVFGVSSTGTFVKSKDATWDETGVNGVPANWTIEVA